MYSDHSEIPLRSLLDWQRTKKWYSLIVLYLWQGILGKPHQDKLIAPVGHIVLGAIPCGDLWNEKQTKKRWRVKLFNIENSVYVIINYKTIQNLAVFDQHYDLERLRVKDWAQEASGRSQSVKHFSDLYCKFTGWGDPWRKWIGKKKTIQNKSL